MANKQVIIFLFFIFYFFHLTAQDLLWKNSLTGAGNNFPTKSVIDSSQNIYIIGDFNNTCNSPTPLVSRGNEDIYITKYNDNGQLVWIKQIGGTGLDFATALTLSKDGKYLYVTGIFSGTAFADGLSIVSSGSSDGFLAKYQTTDGNIVWFKNIASASTNSTQRPNEIKNDKNQNLIIGGLFQKDIKLGDNAVYDTFMTSKPLAMFVALFDSTGKYLNAKKIESSVASTKLYTLDSDTSGYYISGFWAGDLFTELGTKTSNNNSLDVFIYKLDYNLNAKWFIKLGGSGLDQLYSCSADKKGNFYIGGQFQSSSITVDSTTTGLVSSKTGMNTTIDGKSDIFFAKYNSEGTLQWFNTAGSRGNDYLYRALYKNGDFIVAGQYGDTLKLGNSRLVPKGNGDAFALVHDYNDNLKYLIPIIGSGVEIGETASIDNNGNFIVIGDYTSPKVYFNNGDSLINSNPGTRDMFIAKYDKASLTKTVVPVLCAGSATGQINVTPMGTVVPPYTYSWVKREDPSYTASTANISGLSIGTYVVTFTDAVGYVKKDSVVLTQPASIDIALTSKTNVTCYNDLNGTIDITPSGGVLPYTYMWNGTGSGLTASSEDQSAVSAGTYSVTVTDRNGCTDTLKDIVVTQPEDIHFKGSVVNKILTSPVSPGSITLAVQGGTPGYVTYSWTGPSGFTASTRDIGPLNEAGTYSVQVTDSRGCTGDTSFVVDNGTLLIAYIDSKQDVNCRGGNNGSATAAALNAVGTLSYSWNDPAASTTATANNLSAGTYFVTITDDGRPAGNNTSVTTVTITEPAVALSISAINKTDITCYNSNNGIIDAAVDGGTIPYAYRWTKDGTDFSTTEDLTSLGQGSYELTVTDAKGCQTTGITSISNPQPITVTGNVTPVTCEGGKNDGAISLNVSGGTPSYSYHWSNGLLTKDISLLPANSYTVTVTDSRNCTATLTKSVGYDSVMTVSSSVTNANCNGSLTGTIDLSVQGGHLPLQYSWSSGQTTEDLNGIGAGTYLVTVTDRKSCVKTHSANITEPAVIPVMNASISSQNVNCYNGNDGSAAVTVSNPIGNVTYQWNNADSSATANVSGLSAGTYHVTITDDARSTCQAPSVLQVTISEPALLEVTAVANDISCNNLNDGTIDVVVTGGVSPYTYQWTKDGADFAITEDLTGLSKGNYELTVTDSNGCTAAATALIYNPQPLNATASVSNITCEGGINNGAINLSVSGGTPAYTYLWSNGLKSKNISSLPVGSYTVTVTDSRNCTATLTKSVSYDSVMTVSSVVTNANCNGSLTGAIDLSVQGGHLPLQYSWSSGQTTEDLNGIGAGTYLVTVTDRKSCVKTYSASISEPPVIPVLNAEISSQNVKCYNGNDGSAAVNISNPVGNISYQWDNADSSTTANVSGLSAGTYHVTITDDARSTCQAPAVLQVTITQPALLEATATANDISCNNMNDGAIDVVVNGGVNPYTFQWTKDGADFAATEDLTGLSGGIYMLTLTDANGCILKDTATVQNPKSLTISEEVGPVSCNGNNDGYIRLDVQGGTPSYTYIWTGVTASGSEVSELSPGDYAVTVSDTKGCSITGTYHINEPAALTMSEKLSSHRDCRCYGDSTGCIELTATGGSGQYQFKRNNGLWTDDPLFKNLPAGKDTFRVRDVLNISCQSEFTEALPVVQPDPITPGKPFISKISCFGLNDGSISCSASGGTGSLTYRLKLSGLDSGNQTGSTNGFFTGLGPGIAYTLEVTDANSCTIRFSDTISLSNPDPIVIIKDSVRNASSRYPWNGLRFVKAMGGTGPLVYKWGQFISQNGLFTGLTPGIYTIQVTDQNNCGPVSSNTLEVLDSSMSVGILGDSISFYPNPVRDDLILDFGDTQLTAPVKVEVLTLMGKVVYNETIPELEQGGRYTLHLGFLDKGMYLIRIDKKLVKGKIIVQ